MNIVLKGDFRLVYRMQSGQAAQARLSHSHSVHGTGCLSSLTLKSLKDSWRVASH